MSSFIRENDVRSGPDRYIGELGAAKNIGRFLADYRHPVIVTGKRSWQVFSEYADIVPDYPVFRYDGSATLRNAKELAASISVEGADAIVANCTADMAPGSVILMHDGGGERDQDVEALPRVIEAWQKEGYKFVTLDELLASDSSINMEAIRAGAMPEDAVWPTELA